MKMSHVCIGEFEILPIFDGTIASGLDKMPNAEDRLAAMSLIGAAPGVPIVMAVYGFLVKGSKSIALIDAGTGNKKGPGTGRLMTNLTAAGVSTGDIQRIYMTHWHADHFGGLTDDGGSAVFDKAEVVISQSEARFWFESDIATMPARAQRALTEARAAVAPYRERLRIVPDSGVCGDLIAVPSPGHTPGHTCWLLSGGEASLLAWGDVVHIAPIHLARPSAAFEYDLDADLAARTRRRILEMAASERLLVAGAHLDAPGLSYIVKDGEGFRQRRWRDQAG